MKDFSFNGFMGSVLMGLVLFMSFAAALHILVIGEIVTSLVPVGAKGGFFSVTVLLVVIGSIVFGIAGGFDGVKKLPLDTRSNFVRMYTIDGVCGVLNVRNVNSVSRLHNGQALPYGMYSVEINGAGGAMVFAKCRSNKNPWLKELIDAAGMREWD